jgi:hypothetical protein
MLGPFFLIEVLFAVVAGAIGWFAYRRYKRLQSGVEFLFGLMAGLIVAVLLTVLYSYTIRWMVAF